MRYQHVQNIGEVRAKTQAACVLSHGDSWGEVVCLGADRVWGSFRASY